MFLKTISFLSLSSTLVFVHAAFEISLLFRVRWSHLGNVIICERFCVSFVMIKDVDGVTGLAFQTHRPEEILY